MSTFPNLRIVSESGNTDAAPKSQAIIAATWIDLHKGHDGDECLIWPYARDADTGYGRVNVGGRIMTASRVMCASAHGQPPNDTDRAAHSCGNGHLGCVHPGHLRWRSPSQNTREKHDHGTMTVGERNPAAKLTADTVRLIRREYGAGGISLADVGRRYGVSGRTVSDVVRGVTWGHVA